MGEKQLLSFESNVVDVKSQLVVGVYGAYEVVLCIKVNDIALAEKVFSET